MDEYSHFGVESFKIGDLTERLISVRLLLDLI